MSKGGVRADYEVVPHAKVVALQEQSRGLGESNLKDEVTEEPGS